MVPTQRFRQMRFSPVSLWIVAKLLKHSLTATDQVAVKSCGHLAFRSSLKTEHFRKQSGWSCRKPDSS